MTHTDASASNVANTPVPAAIGPRSEDKQSRSTDRWRAEPGTVVRRLQLDIESVVGALASLRMTVILMALAIFVVFTGTLAQIDRGIWTVIDQYFRTLFAWVELRIFFPRQWQVPGGFYFPGGWLIATLLLLNLIAAHAARMKVYARGPRLVAGVLTVVLGAAATWLVIAQGIESDRTIVNLSPSWRILWQLMQGGGAAAVLLLGCVLIFKKRAGIVLLHSGVALLIISELITGTFAVESTMTIAEGETVDFVDRSVEYELALIDPSNPEHDQVVVVPHTILQEKRLIQDDALPVDLRVVDYMVNSSLIVSTDTLQAQIDSLAEEIARLETVGLDGSVAGHQHGLAQMKDRRQQLVIELARIRDRIAGTPVTAGAGLRWYLEGKPEGTGVGEMEKDAPAAYVSVMEKDTGKSLGTYLVSLWFYPNFSGRSFDEPQIVTVAGKTYTMVLRNTREYLRSGKNHAPFSIRLVDFRHDVYIGTDTPKNYSSDVVLNDPDRGVVDREVRIWMNNPMRFSGRIYYQASFLAGDAGTVLQVVKNAGWMVPYVACMIVATGLLAQFGMHLVGFLRRRAAA